MPLAYIHFEPCPKCSETSTPELHLAGKGESGPKYRAICGTCHYGQRDAYDSIEDCAKAWNKESNEAWGYILDEKMKQLMRRFNDFN